MLEVAPFGLRLDLGEGCPGLVHVKRLQSPLRAYSPGQRIAALVLGLDPELRTASLRELSREERDQRIGDRGLPPPLPPVGAEVSGTSLGEAPGPACSGVAVRLEHYGCPAWLAEEHLLGAPASYPSGARLDALRVEDIVWRDDGPSVVLSLRPAWRRISSFPLGASTDGRVVGAAADADGLVVDFGAEAAGFVPASRLCRAPGDYAIGEVLDRLRLVELPGAAPLPLLEEQPAPPWRAPPAQLSDQLQVGSVKGGVVVAASDKCALVDLGEAFLGAVPPGRSQGLLLPVGLNARFLVLAVDAASRRMELRLLAAEECEGLLLAFLIGYSLSLLVLLLLLLFFFFFFFIIIIIIIIMIIIGVRGAGPAAAAAPEPADAAAGRSIMLVVVCILTYICIYKYICIHVYIYIYIYTYMYTLILVYIYIYIYIYTTLHCNSYMLIF